MTVRCEQCSKEQQVRPARAKTYRFCSYACRGTWRKTNWTGENHPNWQSVARTKNCQLCGNSFSIGKTTAISTFMAQKFCSKTCADVGGLRHFGPENSRWSGGITPRNRGSAHYYWADAIRSRDLETCQHCGANGITMAAHHIKSYKDFPELRYELSNGITLCEPCHRKVHAAQNENGMNSVEPQTGGAVGNTEPSLRGNLLEGVTTRGRAYRRWSGPCDWCGKFLSKQLSDVTGKKNIFCSYSCSGKHRAKFGGAFGRPKAVISSTSLPHESEDIV